MNNKTFLRRHVKRSDKIFSYRPVTVRFKAKWEYLVEHGLICLVSMKKARNTVLFVFQAFLISVSLHITGTEAQRIMEYTKERQQEFVEKERDKICQIMVMYECQARISTKTDKCSP